MNTPGLDHATVDQLRRDLLTDAGNVQIGRQVIQAWELSAVERVFLADGSSIVYKAAAAPFTNEAAVLQALNEQGAAVPALHRHAIHNRTLGMLMEDLGNPLRPPTTAEAAAAAARIHALPPMSALPTLDQAALAYLPEQALDALTALHQQTRFLNTGPIEELLEKLAKVARERRNRQDLWIGEFVVSLAATSGRRSARGGGTARAAGSMLRGSRRVGPRR